MARSATSYSRKKPSLAQQPTVLIICEDEKSSKDYLTDAKVHFRASASVEVVHLGKSDPRSIVRQGIERLRRYDQVYCVIDRDTHPTFDEAISLAQGHKNLKMIVSYPCFEYWLCLHFQYSRRTFRRKGSESPAQQIIKVLRSFEGMDGYDKGDCNSLFQKLLPRLPVAIDNSKRSQKDAANDSEMDPSTSFHILLEKLQDLGLLKIVIKNA
jgi:hypothetical protein